MIVARLTQLFEHCFSSLVRKRENSSSFLLGVLLGGDAFPLWSLFYINSPPSFLQNLQSIAS